MRVRRTLTLVWTIAFLTLATVLAPTALDRLRTWRRERAARPRTHPVDLDRATDEVVHTGTARDAVRIDVVLERAAFEVAADALRRGLPAPTMEARLRLIVETLRAERKEWQLVGLRSFPAGPGAAPWFRGELESARAAAASGPEHAVSAGYRSETTVGTHGVITAIAMSASTIDDRRPSAEAIEAVLRALRASDIHLLDVVCSSGLRSEAAIRVRYPHLVAA